MNQFLLGLLKTIQLAPLAAPAALAAFSIVAMVLLLLGRYDSYMVWPLGLLAAAGAVFVAAKAKISRPGSTKEQQVTDVIVVGGIIIWCIWNMAFASQHIFTNRDPATYANAAAWLAHHNNLTIDTPQVFGADPKIQVTSPGFDSLDQNPTEVSAQGQHLLSALLGLGGRVVGDSLMLRLTPIFGAVALLAVYGFARHFIRPRWAAVGVAALALTLPMVHFSRDTYTEPLALAFIFGSLSALWAAHQSKSKNLWFLAGLVAGAGALIRIDIYITLAGFAAFLALYLFAQQKGSRKPALQNVAWFLAGALIPIVVGTLDAMVLSPYYFAHHKHLLLQELAALFAVMTAGAIAVFLRWRTSLLKNIRRTNWLGPVLAVLVIATSIGLASRPLWYTATSPQQDNNVAALQQREGDPILPRTYDESTTDWVAWYIGAPLAILGVIGLAMAASNATKKDQLILAAGILALVVTALVYLLRPSVAPDQIWASRRFLPVVIPGLIIFAMYALDRLSKTYLENRPFSRTLTVLAVIGLLIPPLATSREFLLQRDVVQVPVIKGLCDKLPDNAAVLWLGDGQYYTVQPTRSYCNVPTASFSERAVSKDQLANAAAAAKAAGYTPVIAVLGGDLPLVGANQLSQVSEQTYQEMEMRLIGPPRNTDAKTVKVFAGQLQPNGTITPLD